MFKVPFEVIMRRAKENCERDGKEWKVAVRKANGKFDKKPKPGISESKKRTYILDDEQQILREINLTI
jgi:hypothetical protein